MVQLRNFIKNKKGEIDMILILFVVFLGISLITTTIEPFIVNQNLTSMAELIVEEVEYRGLVDSSIHSYINTLSSEFNLNDKDFNYHFNGNIMPSGKIQLRDEFNFTVEVDVKLKFANINDFININIPLKKTFVGTSQVYYRPSEL